MSVKSIPCPRRNYSLTAKEQELVDLLKSVPTLKEAGAQLGLKPATVYKRMENIRDKLGTKGLWDLIGRAV